MNRYYLITAPGHSSTNFKNAVKRGVQKGLPHEIVHWRWNLDESKVIIQGEFSDEDITWLENKPWVAYLGDYIKGKAEQSVIDYLEANKDEWETKMEL